MYSGKIAIFTPEGLIQIIEEESPDPNPDEILVHLHLAGVCGSDVHRVAGDIPRPNHPICFGHEAVGIIQKLGQKIKTDRVGAPIKEGDFLYWCPSTPCRNCQECTLKNPLQCKFLKWPVTARGPNAAGFREYATLKQNCTFIRISDPSAAMSVIAFGCAMPTALRGFRRLPKGVLTSTTDVVIQGCGPVGLACTLLSKIAGARTITVIGDPEHRLDAARALGATATLSLSGSTVADRTTEIRCITEGRGASLVVEAAGVPAAFTEGFDFLGLNGVYLILGLYSGNAKCSIDPVRINNLNIHIIGSLGIDVEDYERTVEIASRYGDQMKLAELVTHLFPLQNLKEAIQSVADGAAIKAIVHP